MVVEGQQISWEYPACPQPWAAFLMPDKANDDHTLQGCLSWSEAEATEFWGSWIWLWTTSGNPEAPSRSMLDWEGAWDTKVSMERTRLTKLGSRKYQWQIVRNKFRGSNADRQRVESRAWNTLKASTGGNLPWGGSPLWPCWLQWRAIRQVCQS